MSRSALIFALPYLLGSVLLPPACLAGDWGYDEGVGAPKQQAVQPMRASALPGYGKTTAGSTPTAAASCHPASSGRAPAMPRASAGKARTAGQPPAAVPAKTKAASAKQAAGPLAHEDANLLVRACWQQIYELAGGNKLNQDQQAHLAELLNKQLADGGAGSNQAKSVLAFWPGVMHYLVEHREQKDNYALLMRALLRYRARSASNALSEPPPDAGVSGVKLAKGMQLPKLAPVLSALAQDECALIVEVLGAQRFAVNDTPPFTEEAVDAYADMACFIYEQRNPGKTIDAMDNRAMFANIVCEKFRSAPTEKDKAAMASFDLSWAKFKIAWTEAGEKTRAAMLQKLISSGAGLAWAEVHDRTLEAVLTNWPAFRAPSLASNEAASQRK